MISSVYLWPDPDSGVTDLTCIFNLTYYVLRDLQMQNSAVDPQLQVFSAKTH